jgi:hypothetical protein
LIAWELQIDLRHARTSMRRYEDFITYCSVVLKITRFVCWTRQEISFHDASRRLPRVGVSPEVPNSLFRACNHDEPRAHMPVSENVTYRRVSLKASTAISRSRIGPEYEQGMYRHGG